MKLNIVPVAKHNTLQRWIISKHWVWTCCILTPSSLCLITLPKTGVFFFKIFNNNSTRLVYQLFQQTVLDNFLRPEVYFIHKTFRDFDLISSSSNSCLRYLCFVVKFLFRHKWIHFGTIMGFFLYCVLSSVNLLTLYWKSANFGLSLLTPM